MSLLILAAAMFAAAPIFIAYAPNEATMGLVYKIVYFHVPAWFMMFLSIFVCGIASGIYLFKERVSADRLAYSAAEVAVLFGAIGLTTGPLWARVSWGVWWPWDVRTTLALILEMTFVAYLLLRKYGGIHPIVNTLSDAILDAMCSVKGHPMGLSIDSSDVFVKRLGN